MRLVLLALICLITASCGQRPAPCGQRPEAGPLGTGSVDRICQLMQENGFPVVKGIACSNEPVTLVKRTYGKFLYTGIHYGSPGLERVAAWRLEPQATRLETLLLVLDSNMPYPAYNGWFPPRVETAAGFVYREDSKVTIVQQTPTRTIRHIAPAAAERYYSVETPASGGQVTLTTYPYYD